MKGNLVLTMVIGLAFPLLAQAATWQGVPAVDLPYCSQVTSNPGAHATWGALTCALSGYGINHPDGSFLRFDDAGDTNIGNLLNQAKKKDHARVTVEGGPGGDTIEASSVSLN